MYDLIVKPLEFYYGLWPNYAGAIALLTLTIMILLLPLTLKGTRSMLAMQKLQPQMKAIQAKHRDDRQKMNEEMLKFYQENKINPMAGCLPLLLQMPVFFILYSTINGLVHRAPFGQDLGAAASRAVTGVNGGVYENFGNFEPKYLDHGSSLFQDLNATNEMRSFGLDLADSATKAWGSGIGHALPYLILVLAVAGTSYYQQRQIAGRQKNQSDNPMNQQQQMLMKIMPIFFSFISLTLPAGIVVYFLVSNLFRIAQQAFITRTMYRDDHGPVSTTAKESGPKGPVDKPKGFMEQFREIAPSPSRAKEDFRKTSGSGSGKGGGGTKTQTTTSTGSTGRTGGSGQKPSRQAPSNANRSKSKKKRK